MPKDNEQQESTHQNLINAAKYVIGLPFSQSWENDVTESLARLETFEHGNGLDITAHQLLEDAILDKLAFQGDMSADELEAYLRALGTPIETGGEVRHDGTTGPRDPKTGNSPKTTEQHRPDPKAARIIASLVRNHNIDPKKDLEILIIPQARDFFHHKEPTWIIGIKPWGRQIAVCNVSGEGSYVGKGLRTIGEWQEILSDKTRLRSKDYQQDNNLINIPKNNISDEKHTARLIDAAQNGVENARVTAGTILDCMYYFIRQKNELPGQQSENLLRPNDTFVQYNMALHSGKIDGHPKGSSLAQLLLGDLAHRAKTWRKERKSVLSDGRAVLPDETTDEVIDPDHEYLSQITWKDIGTLIKNTRGKSYGFWLSEDWQNRGFVNPKTPQNARELTRINAALRELSENDALPKRRTNTNLPDGKRWDNEDLRLKRKEDSSLPREWRKTGLNSIETAWNTTLSAADFEAAGDSLAKDLDGARSIFLLPENLYVRKIERARIEGNEPN